jgi:hypothetical protein
VDDERTRWARAFWWQAESDLTVYDVLTAPAQAALPRCHGLHYLQMACEKVAKAYRARDTAAELHGDNGLLRRHVGFEKFMKSFLLSPQVQSEYEGRTEQLQQVGKAVRALAREVEKLAPAVDAAVAPENTEYPWIHGDTVVAPRDYDYSRLSLLAEPGGRTFLKLIRLAVERFDTIKVH